MNSSKFLGSKRKHSQQINENENATLGKSQKTLEFEGRASGATSKPKFESVESRKMFLSNQFSLEYVPEQIYGLEESEKILADIFERTMKHGTSTATLLLGPRGCGKSLLVKKTLKSLKEKYNQKARSYIEIYLNGKIHRDDFGALKEICRQLCVENGYEFHGIKSGKYENLIEMMSSFLNQSRIGGFSVFFVSILPYYHTSSKILDEFHEFASRKRQTLLYLLSNLLQSADVQFGLIGMSSHLDSHELLEKRILSRTSYRRILVKKVLEMPTVMRILKKRMLIQARDKCESKLNEAFGIDNLKHNRTVEKLFETDEFRNMIQHFLDCGKDVGWLLHFCGIAVNCLSEKQPFITIDLFRKVDEIFSQDYRICLLKNCSTLELFLIVAMMHLEEKGFTWYNFALIHKECDSYFKNYQHLSIDSLTELFSKNSCFQALQQLKCLNLVECSSENRFNKSNMYQDVRLALFRAEVRKLIIEKKLSCPAWLFDWVKRWRATN